MSDDLKDEEYLNLYEYAIQELDEEETAASILEITNYEKRYAEELSDFAEGGMKELKKDYDLLFKRPVLKAFIKNRNTHEKVDRLIKEARIMASLEHPNIVPVYDLGVTDDKVYFSMKILSGENLEDHVIKTVKNGASPDELRIFDIFLKICDAISYAHSKGVLHLDLKPSNIQLDAFGEVLVCDWGIAKRIGEEEDHYSEEGNSELDQTLDGTVKGTPGYMAPEQISSTPEGKSHTTDIYGLGAILYFLYTRTPPITGKTTEEILKKTLGGELTPLNKTILPCPKAIEAVIMKALSQKQTDRYSSVQELTSEIRSYMSGWATNAEQASVLKLLFLIYKRNKALVLLVAALLILSVAFVFKIQTEQAETNKALVKLKEEKQARTIANKKACPKAANLAVIFSQGERFNGALTTIKYAYELDETNQSVALFYAHNLTGNMEFSKALKILSELKDQNKVPWLKEWNLKFQKYEQNGLNPDLAILSEFFKFLDTLHYSQNKKLKEHLIYTLCRTYSLEDRIKFATSFFTRTGEHYKLESTGEFYSLSLAGNKSFRKLNYLQYLPVDTLDLSNTKIEELKLLTTLPLKRLNLSNTIVSKVRHIMKMKIEYLNLDKTLVSDVGPLKEMPIKTLILSDLRSNIYHLKHCKTLEEITIPKGIYSEEELSFFGENNVKVNFK